MKGVISFTIDDREFWDRYAKERGFRTASDLARFAIVQYEARYRSKERKDVKPERDTGEK